MLRLRTVLAPRARPCLRRLNFSTGDGSRMPPRKDGIQRAKVWEDMPFDVQSHWRELGWTASSWHGLSDPPDSESLDFTQLSARQISAARALGYDQRRWENDEGQWEKDASALGVDAGLLGFQPLSSSADLTERSALNLRLNVQLRTMKNSEWMQMSKGQRALWAALGWTERAWNGDGYLPVPESTFKDFDQLTASEQAAARGLGYTAATWDADEPEIVEQFWNTVLGRLVSGNTRFWSTSSSETRDSGARAALLDDPQQGEPPRVPRGMFLDLLVLLRIAGGLGLPPGLI